ncbi:MAG: hypothetical protein L0Z70_12755 [Chloroflexi bacterium]|nr:hypothetical protein [Chloroflexota bacterium]
MTFKRAQITAGIAANAGGLLAAALFFLAVYFFFPFRDVFWMDADEGINLVKAQMLLRGYSLYGDIWSDQPPLFTYLLAFVLNLRMEAALGRTLALLFSSSVVWALFQMMKMVGATIHAVAALILLLLLPRYVELSVSIMVGLPAIALAVLSLLALMAWRKEGKTLWLAVSAAALALSVLTKLFTAFLAPLFGLFLLAWGLAWGWGAEGARGKALTMLRPALLWGLIFALLTLVPLLLLAGPGRMDQLLANHWNAAAIERYTSNPAYRLDTQLAAAWPLLLLALAGLSAALLAKKWLLLLPGAWMICAYLLLRGYAPVWSHQQLLITVPAVPLAAWISGEAILRLVALFRSRPAVSPREDALRAAGLVLLIVFCLVQAPTVLGRFQIAPVGAVPPYRETTTEARFMSKVLKYAPGTRWMVTDAPMYAFYANLPTPPNLVVLSSKRLETGNLSEEQIIQTIVEYGAEQVLLGRNPLPRVRAYLQENYILVHARDDSELIELYVSKEQVARTP